MSTISEYIRKLDNFARNVDIHIEDIILKHDGKLLATVKLRLYNKSLDANYNFLGIYSPFTKDKKKSKGQISNRVTLRDTGSWYGSMFIDFVNQEIIVDSTEDTKTNKLMDIYGEAILGLTEQETSDFVDTILDPELQRMIDDLGDINIEL